MSIWYLVSQFCYNKRCRLLFSYFPYTVFQLDERSWDVGKMRPVRLRLISASHSCWTRVRLWVRFRTRFRVRVGKHIEVA